MSDITQQLGFDASPALASLATLNNALAQFEAGLQRSATALREFNSAGGQASSTLQRLAGGTASAGNSLRALGSSSQQMASAIQTSTASSAANIGRLTTSVQLLSRIAFTQASIRALNSLRLGLESTAKGAVDFQKQIALTQTIDQSGQSFEQLANSVRGVSDQFNIPLLQTAEGLYNTISNQVGDATQSLEFLTEAAKFAKATNSSLANSVDLLSGAMKSYGLGVEDTNKVSSIFFKSIDLGRITADRLANSFGRVGPIGEQLGLSLEEINAAIDAVSIKGSNSAESLTQLRGVMTALLKPTKDMKAALGDLGFTSGEIAVETLGFSGVLKALADRTGGSSTEMAKLFQNVRGLSGATSLTSDGLRTLANNIDEMTAAGRNFNDERFLIATNTDAERVTKEINKLKNAFTVDLGQSILKAGANLSEFVGGADAVTSAVKIAGPAVAGLGGSLLTMRASANAAQAGLTGVSKAINAIAAAELALGAGKSLGDFLENVRSKSALSPLQELEKSNAEGLKAYKSQLDDARDAGNRADQERLRSALQYTQSLSKVYLQQQADLAASNKVIEKLQGKRNLTPTQAVQLVQAQRTRAQAQAQNPLANVQGLGELQTLLARQINTPDQLSRGLIELEKRAEAARAQLVQLGAKAPVVDNLKSEINSIFQQVDQRANARESVGSVNADALNQQFDNLLTLFREVQKDGQVTAGELDVLVKLSNQFRENATGGSILSSDRFVQRLGFSSSIELLDQALAKMKQLSELPAADIAPISQQLQQFDSVLQRFSTNLQEGAATSAAIANNFERAAQASALIKVPAGAQSQGFAEGGLVHYLADGGFAPRGTDTIPAMLSPGEFVVNASATRKFYAQLVAINSGRQPIYRAEGGPTSNVTFSGDIHVTENNSGLDTARQLMDQVRRELRRSTGRL